MPSIIDRIKFSQAGSQSRKGRSKSTASVAPADEEADENLNLFSKNRQSLPLSSSDHSAGSETLRRLSFMSGKVLRSGLDDLISSADKEKHDYDWLLTPPGTPLDPSSDGNEPQATLAPLKGNVLARSQSVSKSNASSKLSVFQSESNPPPSRLTRSSSVTRSQSTASQFSTHSSIMSSSVLNTSSASVSSYIRPSSPIRQSFSSARPISSPSATPSRATLIPRCASTDRARPSRSSVPSAPSPRIQIPACSSTKSSSSGASSRGSTPTRRISGVSPSSLSSSMSLMARPSPTKRTAASRSCPSSPGPRVRPLPQMDMHDVPPNLRISLPNRALSTGRTRPGLPSLRANSESVSSHNARSKQFSPISRRASSSEPVVRGRPTSIENANTSVARRIPTTPESTMRKPVKSTASSVPESSMFRRTISTKSMDMSVRHMDNKVSTGRVQSGSGGILYPHSMRPAAASKSQIARTSPPSVSDSSRIKLVGNRGANSDGYHSRSQSILSREFQDPDMFENYRLDASLLDLKSTNWLCSFEDNSENSGLMFDHGSDHLPEPFGPP